MTPSQLSRLRRLVERVQAGEPLGPGGCPSVCLVYGWAATYSPYSLGRDRVVVLYPSRNTFSVSPREASQHLKQHGWLREAKALLDLYDKQRAA